MISDAEHLSTAEQEQVWGDAGLSRAAVEGLLPGGTDWMGQVHRAMPGPGEVLARLVKRVRTGTGQVG